MLKNIACMTLLGTGASAFATEYPTGAIDVMAGGPDPALGADCSAWVSSHEATHLFSVESSEASLFIVAESDEDTVLFIEGPDGRMECNDDELGKNPAIMFEEPAPGDYKIWLGTYSRSSGADATLFIMGAPDSLQASREADAVLRHGFGREAIETEAGGLFGAGRLDGDNCEGFVAETPSHTFRYEAGKSSLRVGVESAVDTTIVVQAPFGEQLLCNDDSGDHHHASVQVRDPQDGLYHVWAGVYAPGDMGASATLFLEEVPESELDGPSVEPRLASHGTGFSVSPDGHVLTNDHVVDDCERITYRRLGRAEMEAELIRTDEAADLALLRVASRNGAFASLSRDLPAMLGQEIGILGFPGSAEFGPTFTTGGISSLAGFEGSWLEMTHNAEIQSGSSGSPMLDSAGNLIGIVTGRLSSASGETVNVNYGTRGFVIQLFLQANGVPFQRAPSATPRTWPVIAERASEYVGVVGCWQ